jgi:hypothetical protein
MVSNGSSSVLSMLNLIRINTNVKDMKRHMLIHLHIFVLLGRAKE